MFRSSTINKATEYRYSSYIYIIYIIYIYSKKDYNASFIKYWALEGKPCIIQLNNLSSNLVIPLNMNNWINMSSCFSLSEIVSLSDAVKKILYTINICCALYIVFETYSGSSVNFLSLNCFMINNKFKNYK